MSKTIKCQRPDATSRPGRALLLGLLTAVAMAALQSAFPDNVLELRLLDARFRHIPTAAMRDDLVHVDIDDRSLETIGRWPWPRATLAGAIDALRQAGAEAIVLDVIFPAPQAPRYVGADTELYNPDESPRMGSGGLTLVFDDAELAAAMASHGRVYLPMHLDFSEDDPPGGQIELDVQRALRDRPTAPLADLRDALLDPGQREASTAAHDQLVRAYLRQRSLDHLRRLTICQAPPHMRSGTLIPPLVSLAGAARWGGYVSFESVDDDGVLRRMPMVRASGGLVYPQFALAVAAETFFAGPPGQAGQIVLQHRGVLLRRNDGAEILVPLDAEGQLLINWLDLDREFPAIPISAAAEIYRQRQRIARNAALIRLHQVQWARAIEHRQVLQKFAEADRLHHDLERSRWQRQAALLWSPDQVQGEPPELLAAQQAVENDLEVMLAYVFDDFYIEGGDARLVEKVRSIRQAIGALAEENELIAQQVQEALAQLASAVAGKVCLIGSTATGAADFVPTPLGGRLPGVRVHGNIVNTILTGSFIGRADWWQDMLLALAAGAAAAFLTAFRPVLHQALPGTVLLGAAMAAGNLLAFSRSLWLALAIPLAAMLAVFMVVSAYRQLTEERAKRHIRGVFAQTMSDTLVDHLLANPRLAELGGQKRVISCFFSDLAGFTTISQQLGEQGTVRLLNRYFDRMIEVIKVRHDGYLNKFLGDGILALFGAPVPQDDHARRAVAAAIDCHQELRALGEQLAGELPPGVDLRCRVGVATGEVMVGNCGSSHRIDYTAIGDAVNLASRLESANKFFATGILVDEASLPRRNDDQFRTRPLGRIIVVGSSLPVNVWAVAGRADDPAVPGATEAWAEFAHGLELFAQREFAAAERAFQSVLQALPDDRPAAVYLALARQYQTQPPPPQWQGELQLTEK